MRFSTMQRYEHATGSSGLIDFLQILKGWKRKAAGLRAVLGARGPALPAAATDTRDCAKDIATQMAEYLALAPSGYG